MYRIAFVVFRLLGQCYSELGLYFASVMMPSIKALCELMSCNSLVSLGDLEKAIGKAVQGLGVEAVVASAPMQITGNIVQDERNLWVLPLLRKFVKASRLVFFKDHFIPLAQKCTTVIQRLKNDRDADSRLIHTYGTIEYQIWSLLPSFADEAVDVEAAQANKNFAKLICQRITDFENTRIDTMKAIRNMVVADGTNTGKLAKNSINYLPVLFNIFTNPDGMDVSHKKAAFETIRVYLSIVPETIKEHFMKIIVSTYQNADSQQCKSALLNLARLFIPHITSHQVSLLVSTIEPLIKSAKDRRKQKAAYKILQDILSCESAVTEEYINENLTFLSSLLLLSNSKAATSSRAPRLRCAKVRLVLRCG